MLYPLLITLIPLLLSNDAKNKPLKAVSEFTVVIVLKLKSPVFESSYL